MMLAERPESRCRCREKTREKDETHRYGENAYAGALLALGEMQRAAERAEDREAVSLLLEAVAEKAEREYPGRFRAGSEPC